MVTFDIVPRYVRTVRGISTSTVKTSLVNLSKLSKKDYIIYLFKILPIGVVSKNAIGACKILRIIPAKRCPPALQPTRAT